jgi:hypothetical protein
MNTKKSFAPEMMYADDGTPLVWYKPSSDIQGASKSMAMEGLAPASVDAQITQFQISFFATSVDVAAKLSLGSIFSVSGNFGAKAIFYDVAAATDFYAEQSTDNGSVLYGVRQGIGVRLALMAKNLKAESSLSYAGLAAQAKVSRAEVSYEVQGIGIPPTLIKEMLGAIPVQGSLENEVNYTKLNTFLTMTLPDFLAKPENKLTVSEYIVIPRARTVGSATAYAKSINFAVNMLLERRSLAEALKWLSELKEITGIDRYMVVLVYAQFMGVSDEHSKETPSDEVYRKVRDWGYE